MSLKCLGILVWLLFIAVANASFFLYLWYRFSHGGAGGSDQSDDLPGLPSNLSISIKDEVGRDVNSVARLIEMDASIGSISGE